MAICETIVGFCSFWYFQYTLVTALYMLESWERKVFNSLLITFILMATYTTYLFLPGHIAMWIRVGQYVLGL